LIFLGFCFLYYLSRLWFGDTSVLALNGAIKERKMLEEKIVKVKQDISALKLKLNTITKDGNE